LINDLKNEPSQKRRPPAHQHLHPPDHIPSIRRILPSAGSLPSLHHSFRIYDTPLHPDGAEREKYEGKVSGRVRVKVINFYSYIFIRMAPKII